MQTKKRIENSQYFNCFQSHKNWAKRNSRFAKEKRSDITLSNLCFLDGADDENRTHMGSPHAPQTCASTNSATSATLINYNQSLPLIQEKVTIFLYEISENLFYSLSDQFNTFITSLCLSRKRKKKTFCDDELWLNYGLCALLYQ